MIKTEDFIQPPIILLSPGRSGSTLIQRILNTSNNLTIWGEHDGILIDIARSYNKIMYNPTLERFYFSRKSEIESSDIKGSYIDYKKNINWLNSFEKDNTKKLYKSFISDLLNQGECDRSSKWGFKEIRYTINDQVVEMMIDLFPESKFIFSVRNPYDIITSMMLAFYPEEKRATAIAQKNYEPLKTDMQQFVQRVNLFFKSIHQWSNDRRIDSIFIRYEDLVEIKEDTVSKLFDFVGEPVPENSFEPFNFFLEKTQNIGFHEEMHSILMEEKLKLKEILGNYPSFFGYKL